VTHGYSHAQAAWLANQAAGKVVSQYGNRLEQSAMDSLKDDFLLHARA
jgi:hypothetical protein